MGFFKRALPDSDYDPDFIPPPPRKKRALSLPASSPPPGIISENEDSDMDNPASPMQEFTPEDDGPVDDIGPLERLPALFPSPTLTAGPSTPRHRDTTRANSLEPRGSSPLSFVDITPLQPKKKLGRPFYTPETRRLKQTMRQLSSSQRSPERRKAHTAEAELQRKKAEAEIAKQKLVSLQADLKAHEKKLAEEHAAKARDAEDTRRAQEVVTAFSALWRRGGDGTTSWIISKYVGDHGSEHATQMFRRSAKAREEYISQEMVEIFQREGRAIQACLTRDSTTRVTDLLKDFSMEQLAAEIEAEAPFLWAALTALAEPDQSTRRERDGAARRNKGLVFTTICALISVLRSQKANNFQLVIGLFLLGSGASKREMEVLAHAGLSVSYASIIKHVKTLSKEGLEKIREVCRTSMVQVVWDNLNIAFKVSAERLNAKSHFDSGTTSTVIPVFDPSTSTHAPHGTLPLDMKPPRERTLPVLDWSPEDVLPSPESSAQLSKNCLWQLKRIALEHIPGVSDKLKKGLGQCPEVHQIPLHQSEQYPLPALKEDESTLEGTLTVYTKILQHMGMGDKELAAHGLMFDDGDLLTDSLKEKANLIFNRPIAGMRASVRRWGLFHAQMAGCRLTINEHWGTPNSPWPGGLWWEHNKLLKRKPLTAGWGGKKATEWKPAHELIHISLPAHIVDGFRIYCGHDSLSEWAKSATVTEFDAVAETVFGKLFSTAAVNDIRARKERDITLENAILYNRDALFYIELTLAIKTGDIGRVLNVLAIWMVMMRSPKTMPRYADAIFETLVRIKNFPPKLRALYLANWLVNLTGKLLRFKAVDLLQEHQNFWAKIIYNAKGTNKSWKWLSMITVCIFTLREAMRTVQTAFQIPAYGEKHKNPPIHDEVALIAKSLEDDKIQTYVQDRPANDHVNPVRDLIKEGAVYANSRKAFHRFTRDTRRPEKQGFDLVEDDGQENERDEEDEEGEVDEYTPTEEDLRLDDEEFLMEPEEMMASAMDIVDSMLNGSDGENE
ncbi:hypothetical protein MSAN_00583000 [Mycena sanguinolenta]|uniref:DUF6589 domain-containing protein n=1 Tax=Mycena sanguinolenta TaxID=230812 RepID=A0A8H7DGQ4_9AGAR|nr:hypothetical protein MSAN_00583000 [Mycena sanguinolenta]